MTAKTSFDEWVEVLRNAEFIFGNDSGYIHLASMLRTKSFVIAGFWNYGRFCHMVMMLKCVQNL